MEIALQCKEIDRLVPTTIVQQTAFWGRVKHRLGLDVQAFDLQARVAPEGVPGCQGDFLVLRRPLPGGGEMAYVPFGPELNPGEGVAGPFLEQLSWGIRRIAGPRCSFVRWDLPWESPYAQDPEHHDAAGRWLGPPPNWVRELRMNWGSATHGLRKAHGNMLPVSTMVVDLTAPEEELLRRMKPKTRYNVHLAAQRGVEVTVGGLADLPTWLALYEETATRHGLPHAPAELFEAVLSESGAGSSSPVTTRLLLARRRDEALAGMILARSGPRATFLYGASTRRQRDCMASYALQWAAMRLAKADGCRDYDLLGVSPRPDEEHPLLGLHRFKSGFGGQLVHREGCWDFPFDPEEYQRWQALQTARACQAATHATH